jgi:hypothetical protein
MYDLYNYTISSSHCITSNDRMVTGVNWKGYGESSRGLIFGRPAIRVIFWGAEKNHGST